MNKIIQLISQYKKEGDGIVIVRCIFLEPNPNPDLNPYESCADDRPSIGGT